MKNMEQKQDWTGYKAHLCRTARKSWPTKNWRQKFPPNQLPWYKQDNCGISINPTNHLSSLKSIKTKKNNMHVAMGRRKGKRSRACQDGNKGEAKRLLTDLPTGIVMDILSWLPLKSLFNCRYVCKTWLQIISDPHFAKLHLSRSSMNILIKNESPRRPEVNLEICSYTK